MRGTEGHYICVRTNLWGDPVVADLSETTRAPVASIVGALCWLWSAAAEYGDGGLVSRLSPERVDHCVGIDGFAGAMIAAGWLEPVDGGMRVPGWWGTVPLGSQAHEAPSSNEPSRRWPPEGLPGRGINEPSEGAPKSAPPARATASDGRGCDDAPTDPSAPMTATAGAAGSAESDGEPGRKSPSKRRAVGEMRTFDSWLKAIEKAGEWPIPANHPSRTYAKHIGLPAQFLHLHWLVFKGRYSGTPKKYVDWRAVFLRSLRFNWFGLWALGGDGFFLTTVGKQAMIEHTDPVGDGNASA